jgi:cysteine desulfurase/selenocysteine lyase
MTTTSFHGAQGNPQDFGLPSCDELLGIAKEYFPEFGADSFCANPAGGFEKTDPAAIYASAVSAGSAVSTAIPAAQAAYTPRVIPKNSGLDTQDIFASAAKQGGGRQTSHNGIFVGTRSLDSIRADFPILTEQVDGRPLVWLDNAATTQKPNAVIERLAYFYRHENSNVHRGAHTLAARSTDAYEDARKKAAAFLGAPSPDNIVFVRGTTEGINLVANAFVKPRLNPGDEIILTILEHHANIVPWQLIAQQTGALLRVAPINKTGELIISEYAGLFNRKTKFVSAAHVSNALGTVNPIDELVHIAHANGVPIMIDGAQSVPHIPVNVSSVGADFYVFSGHKIFAPTGIGVLYGNSEALNAAEPYQGGGNMIADVTFERTLYQPPPSKFEAGTGSIADAVGLGAALDYVSAIGMQNINAWEHSLLQYGMQELEKVPGLTLIGKAPNKASVLSFVLDGHSLEEIGKHLAAHGIAVRAGHHCSQPVHRFFGLEGTVRPSLAFYNTPDEIDFLVRTLRELTG